MISCSSCVYYTDTNFDAIAFSHTDSSRTSLVLSRVHRLPLPVTVHTMPSQIQKIEQEDTEVPPDLFHHLSSEAQKRLPNAMKTFLRSLEDAPEMTSLANGALRYMSPLWF